MKRQQDIISISAFGNRSGNVHASAPNWTATERSFQPIESNDAISLSQESLHQPEDCESGLCANFMAAWG